MNIEGKAEQVADAIEEQAAIDSIGREILTELGALPQMMVIPLGRRRALVVLPGFNAAASAVGDSADPASFLQLATIYR